MIRWTNGGQNHEGGQTAANICDTTGQTMVDDGENEHIKGSKVMMSDDDDFLKTIVEERRNVWLDYDLIKRRAEEKDEKFGSGYEVGHLCLFFFNFFIYTKINFKRRYPSRGFDTLG